MYILQQFWQKFLPDPFETFQKSSLNEIIDPLLFLEGLTHPTDLIPRSLEWFMVKIIIVAVMILSLGWIWLKPEDFLKSQKAVNQMKPKGVTIQWVHCQGATCIVCVSIKANPFSCIFVCLNWTDITKYKQPLLDLFMALYIRAYDPIIKFWSCCSFSRI